jgi:hypothetical protein
MPIWVICAIILIGLPLAGFSLKAAVDFRSYCRIIAKKQGRLKEFQDFLSADENALNRFEREQFKKLMRGDIDAKDDGSLLVWARRLSNRLRLLRLSTFLFVVAVGVAYFAS